MPTICARKRRAARCLHGDVVCDVLMRAAVESILFVLVIGERWNKAEWKVDVVVESATSSSRCLDSAVPRR